jgi:hypothetical protein
MGNGEGREWGGKEEMGKEDMSGLRLTGAIIVNGEYDRRDHEKVEGFGG